MASTANLTADSTLELRENDKPVETVQSFKDLSLLQKVLFVKNILTVEPFLCCYVMPTLIAVLAVANLKHQMACRVNLQFGDTICSDLLSPNNTEYEKQVEVMALSMLPWTTPLSSSIPAVMVLFLGSYSDRHRKRKPFLLMPLLGELMSTTGFILCALNLSTWRMEISGVAENLFPALTGGLTVMMMSVYSYIADVTTVENRTFRFGLVHILAASISSIGFAVSGILFQSIGFYGVFTISLIVHVTGLLYCVFYIKEPRTAPADLPKKNVCFDIFDPRHVIDTIVVVFKKRSGSERTRIILLMLTFVVILGPNYGEASLVFHYTRAKFQWGPVQYSLYQTYDLVIHLIGTTVAISVFSQWLQLDDLLLATIACCSKVAAAFVYAFAPTTTVFYFAPFISIVSGSGSIAMRSIATKLVAQNELGKIQSLFGICEGLAPSLYANLYTKVYEVTINVLPGAFFLVGALLISPAILIFLAMYMLQKRDAKRREAEENEKKHDSFKYVSSTSEM
ncbi:uncharacterized protein CBL_08214 [Carabus blaptoides fortunei]